MHDDLGIVVGSRVKLIAVLIMAGLGVPNKVSQLKKEPYFTGDKIKIVKAKDDSFNAKNALYFLTSMNKSFQVYSWGSSSFNVDILSKEKMFLPLQNNEPDYSTMETFISAIQKLVIKDVVLYADKKIHATKEVVEYHNSTSP